MNWIRISISILAAQCCFSTSIHAQGVFFDFQQVPTGTLPGGFLQLENNGVTAFFSGNGTSISMNPTTGQNAIHLGTFQGQMGVQFNIGVREIRFLFDRGIPGATHTMKIAGVYTANGSIVPPGSSPPLTSADTFTYRRAAPIWGVLLENVDNGFALSSITISTVPEPSTSAIVAVWGMLVLTRRASKRRSAPTAAGCN